jgi:hypothetical protein
VSEPAPPTGRERPPETVADDEYATAYSEGYGEGLREAFREILQHASRGHTAQELRFLIESRLARLREDIELKRRSVLSPPRRPAWGAILRPPTAAAAPPPRAARAPAVAGASYLFREERPERALALVEVSRRSFPRVLAIALRPPAMGAGEPTVEFLPVSTGGVPGAIANPTELSGRIRAAAEAEGGALVYLDAFDTLTTEVGIEPMLKFVTWLVGEAARTRSAVILSIDPGTLDPRSMSLLQRIFQFVE